MERADRPSLSARQAEAKYLLKRGRGNAYVEFDALLARIIHQPENMTKEGALESWMMLKATVSQAHYAPKTSTSGCSEPVQIGVMVALRHNAPW